MLAAASSARGPLVRSQLRHRLATTSPAFFSSAAADKNIKSVAVLGGGITGLSAAWYLSKFAPGVPVTIFEKSPRLGGWLNSKRVNYDGGSVLFETGPRTLRPKTASGMVTLDMIRQLKLQEEVVMVSKDSPAAKNRFIYYPDRLNQLPNDAVSAMLSTTLPVMKSVIPGIFMALFKRMGPLEHSDESIGSFFTRLCGPNLSQNVISAVLHGIYAGDVDKLSVKTLFPNLWRAGILDRSVLGSITSPDGYKEYENCLLEYQLASKENGAMQWMFANANVYSFTDGIETLSQALVADLAKKLNITIKTSTPVSMITYKADTYPLRFSVNGEAHSHVISTLYAPVTNALLPQKLQVPELAQIPAVTVLVVNLYFATPNLLPVEGFGYLLPKSLTEDQNPHKALGVIFDSCTTPHPSENGTKLTVMLGGHHWYGRTKYPDDAEAVSMARDVLRQHLKITEDPVATHVTLNRDCIPQYNVGHDQKIKRIKEGLMESFEGRLSVAGASYKGVGLNDCVRSARDVVVGLTERSEGVWTGLEGLGDEKIYVSPEEQLRIREKVLDER